jgi:hypothetical protein
MTTSPATTHLTREPHGVGQHQYPFFHLRYDNFLYPLVFSSMVYDSFVVSAFTITIHDAHDGCILRLRKEVHDIYDNSHDYSDMYL